MSWIKQLLEQTEIYEAPRHYYFWAGLAAISASVKDHVWIPRSDPGFKTYPNIYVLLLAKTGITRKSHPISLIEQIVNEAKVTRVISGRGSIEKVLDDLGTAYTTEDKRMIKDSSCLLISGELSASFIGNNQTLTILTNLFDRSYNVNKWQVNLKSGVKILTKPTITFLAATNDMHMKTFFEAKDMYGGFLARTFVISADAPKRLNPLLRKSPVYPDIKALGKYLNSLSKIEGEFKIEEDVLVYLEKWYENYYGPVYRGESDINDKTGTFSRVSDHALKVAMLLSLSESPDLEIRMEHATEAIRLCEPFVEVSARAVRGIGKSPLAIQTAMVMEYLEQHEGRATRHQILNAFQGDIDYNDLNSIAINLEETKFAIIEVGRGYTAYQMPKGILDRYRKWKEDQANSTKDQK